MGSACGGDQLHKVRDNQSPRGCRSETRRGACGVNHADDGLHLQRREIIGAALGPAQGANVVAAFGQQPGDVTADEAGAAGDKDGLRRTIDGNLLLQLSFSFSLGRRFSVGAAFFCFLGRVAFGSLVANEKKKIFVILYLN